MKTIATFATGMRAASLVEHLWKAGVYGSVVEPRWTNKRLPPPKVEVQVGEENVAAAQLLLEEFNRRSA